MINILITKTYKIKFFLLSFLFIFYSCDYSSDNYIDKNIYLDSITNLVYESDHTKNFKIQAIEKFENNIINEKHLSQKQLLTLSNLYYYLNKIEASAFKAKQSINATHNEIDSLLLIKAYDNLCEYYSNKGKPDSAYYYVNEAEKLAFAINNQKWQSKSLYSKAIILSNAKDYLKAEELTIQAYKIAESIDDELLKYECHNFIGMLLTYNHNYEKSENYHKRALIQIPKITHLPHYHEILEAQSYKNLGLNKIAAKDYHSAIKHLKQGLDIPKIENLHSGLYADLLDYHSYSKLKLGQLTNSTAFERALKIRDSLGYTVDIVISKNHLAEFYLENNRTQKALTSNLEAYALAKDINNADQQLKSLNLLTQTDPKNSKTHLKSYIKLNDSLLRRERMQQQKFALIDYETQKINEEKHIAEAKSQKLTTERWFLMSSLGFLIIIGLSSIYILKQKAKNRELIYKNEQKAAKEELYELMIAQNISLEKGKHQERQRISRELHDGVLGRLSGIRLNMFSLKIKQDKQTIENALLHIDSIQDVEKEIRHISHDLASSELPKNHNFYKLVKDLLKDQFSTQKEIDYSCQIDDDINWQDINYTIKLTIFRIIQEALHNIKKHAGAKNVLLEIQKNNKSLDIKIIDDGIGLITENNTSGIGLKNMKDRAISVKGKIAFEKNSPSGTRIILKIPI